MFKIFGLVSLLALTACKSSETKKSKNCEINHEAVDCAVFEQSNAPEVDVVQSKVDSKILIYENRLEVKQRTSNETRVLLNGKLRSCVTSTQAGDLYFFNLYDQYLELEKGFERYKYKRLGKKSDSVLGKWIKEEKTDYGSVETTIEITETEIFVVASCKYVR